ncbi:hypothetical protein PDR5_57430 [Pseudomonas sp. DR 5-09]|nr:hypothetical protein PDR5_57430 [Pseudomonas sp. DR 5-09]
MVGLREARGRCGHGKVFSYSRICRHNNAGCGSGRFGTIANCSKKHIEARICRSKSEPDGRRGVYRPIYSQPCSGL